VGAEGAPAGIGAVQGTLGTRQLRMDRCTRAGEPVYRLYDWQWRKVPRRKVLSSGSNRSPIPASRSWERSGDARPPAVPGGMYRVYDQLLGVVSKIPAVEPTDDIDLFNQCRLTVSTVSPIAMGISRCTGVMGRWHGKPRGAARESWQTAVCSARDQG